MARIGYARVSTTETTSRKAQHVENQENRLRGHGCELIFADKATGKAASRPQWDQCLGQLRKGDTLVVTKLDRIGRSLVNLVDVVRLLGDRGVELEVLDQGIDTSTPNGKLIFHIMAALAEWEAAMIRERTLEGLEAARERHGGKLPVRGPKITQDQIRTAETLASTTDMSAVRIAQVIGVSRAGLYRYVDVSGLREKKAEAAATSSLED